MYLNTDMGNLKSRLAELRGSISQVKSVISDPEPLHMLDVIWPAPAYDSLAGKVIFITGASRGIGKAIALKAAKDGAKIVVAAKTSTPHPKLPGTIFTAAEEIERAGGECLPCIVDVRDETDVQSAVHAAVAKFGGLDIVINNASAISLTGTQQTEMKRYDLMNNINTRGTFLVSKTAIPHLLNSKNPHILNISPPLNMNPRWFRDNVAYTIAKYGMSMCALGMAEEFKGKIAVNALWPRTAIQTAAMEMLGDGKMSDFCRKPEIVSDAAYAILKRPMDFTGNFLIDEDVLKNEGVTDFEKYAVKPGHPLMPDFYLDEYDEWQAKMAQKLITPERGTAAGDTPPSSDGQVDAIFNQIRNILNEDIIQKTGATYVFEIKGKEQGTWYVDLKTPPGVVEAGPGPGSPDVTFTMDTGDFVKMFAGKMKPTTAFMMGKLKIKGDTQKALKLEKVMNNVRSAKM